ncbi:MAG: sugar ABC transporter ATP-binding protein, partial [bacterium]|nr:sugar ABC transporter ATP-binding protein [bacterium]
IDVGKTFPNGTVALTEVCMSVQNGSVHGLVGANGAGKSTLMKVVSGALRPTVGEARLGGELIRWSSPADARSAGVSTIYQHVPLVPTLSVVENVFLGAGGFRRIPIDAHRQLNELCERIGYQIDFDAVVGGLPIGVRQMVSILQALVYGADLVLMDEPTASLDEQEREIVFDVVTRLSAQGTTFVYVSHFLEEVLELCTDVTVLRDGRVVLDSTTEGLTPVDLIESMTERRRQPASEAADTRQGSVSAAPLLEVRGVSTTSGVTDFDLNVAAGEVVGLAGLLGSGRSELIGAILGSDRRLAGEVLVNGEPVGKGPAQAVRSGINVIPEDRWHQGLVALMPIWKNTTLPSLREHAFGGCITRPAREVDVAFGAIDALGIVCSGPEASVTELSGGNAQKVLFGRCVVSKPKVLLLDEPTAGVDAAAKADILELVRTMARAGTAVVMVSSEFEELLQVADRIGVIREKSLVAMHDPDDLSVERLLALVDPGIAEAEAA